MISIVGLSLLTLDIVMIISVSAYITLHTFKNINDATTLVKFMTVILWLLLCAIVAFDIYFWLRV